MAERLKEFDFGPPPPAIEARYPWDSWADGTIWRIVQGVDFDVAPRDMARQVRRVARGRGMSARTHRDSTSVTFQFLRGVVA